MVAAVQTNPIQKNLQLRQILLATAPRMQKDLGTVSGALGQTSRIKLFNVGILTRLRIYVSAVVNIGTATATASPRAPYNLIDRIRLTDYDGMDRINCSGVQLFMWNSVRQRQPFGLNNMGPIYDANGSTEKSGVIVNPQQTLAVSATAALNFYLDIPVAYDPESDLRGAMLCQTAVGELYLNIDWIPTLYGNGLIDRVYNGGATTTAALVSLSCQTWQYYLLPQPVGNGLPLPGLDLTTVYEYAGAIRSSDNLAANQGKLMSYPNVRSVIGAYYNYVTNDTALATQTSRLRVIANGNNILTDNTYISQILNQRAIVGGDLMPGQYWNDHRAKPIETALFGNVQCEFTPATVSGGNQYVEIGYESFYTKGATLPGIAQAQ